MGIHCWDMHVVCEVLRIAWSVVLILICVNVLTIARDRVVL